MKIPEEGYYYHYKHDPKLGVNDHAYKLVGVGLDTEKKTYNVIYRPLYKNTFLPPAQFCVRPYEMFMESVKVEGTIVPRFLKIEDKKIISELEKIEKDLEIFQ